MIITPLAKCQPETIELVDPKLQKAARQSCQGGLPSVFVARKDPEGPFNPETDAALSLRYRRTSHHCELEWWAGTNVEALSELLKVLVMQSMLEGRKRVEIPNIRTNGLSSENYPHEALEDALEDAGFQFEGHYDDWTKQLEDVDIYSFIWLEDGYPELRPDTQATLVNSGEFTRDEKERLDGWGVQFYREKNLKLYQQDKDLHRQGKEDDPRTFAEHIKDAVDYVVNHTQVRRDERWHGKERLPKTTSEAEVGEEIL